MSVFWQKVGFCPHSKKSWARQGSHRHNCGAAPRWTLAIGESSELAARGTRVYRVPCGPGARRGRQHLSARSGQGA